MIRRLLALGGRRAGVRAEPERVVLGVARGVRPSQRPPVRIYVGTEPAHRRAERVFLWSIEQVRDPSRVYEIYLMKELAGFHPLWWLTGFTNYRFAVPYFAGGQGRAIYNDVDQIYLADPAELFDAEINGAGFLAVDRRDSSVMLIDCARMAPMWNLSAARGQRKRSLLRLGLGLHGPLGREWNARDEEYEPGRSKLLHYTALHTQPWHPFPAQFVYQPSPVGRVWLDLERSADAADYNVFTAEAPSRRYSELVAPLATRAVASLVDEDVRDVLATMRSLGAETILDYGAPAGGACRLGDGIAVSARPATLFDASAGPAQFDGVVCRELLQHLPDEDVPWALRDLFDRARGFIYAVVTLPSAPPRSRLEQWFADFESAAARHPQLYWKLVVRTRSRWGEVLTHVRQGGRLPAPPRVWILTQEKPGHTAQSLGLADAIGWPYEIRHDLRTVSAHFRRGLGRMFAGQIGFVAGAASATSEWPDVIIATGWRPSHVARWLRRRSRGRSRLVRIGRKGSQVVSGLDVVVGCAHFRLPPHPRRVETVAPLNQVSAARLAGEIERGRRLFGEAPCPRLALLVGGDTVRHRLDVATARRIGEDVRGFAAAAGGSVFALTSRRTGAEQTRALRAGLGDRGRVHEWKAAEKENPYLAHLAAADAVVVTGESESMLADAVATGKPVYILPLPARQPSAWLRFNDRVQARAHSRRPNRRGTARPQQGVDHLCARAIAWGLLQPPRDLQALHEALIEIGAARFFGAPFEAGHRPALREAEAVAARVIRLLACSAPREETAATAASPRAEHSATTIEGHGDARGPGEE